MFVTVGDGLSFLKGTKVWFFDRLVSGGDNTRRYVETMEIGSRLVVVAVVSGAFGECQRLSCPGGGGGRPGGGGVADGCGNGRSFRYPNTATDGNTLSNADGDGNGNGRSFCYTDGAADINGDAGCRPNQRAHSDNGR